METGALYEAIRGRDLGRQWGVTDPEPLPPDYPLMTLSLDLHISNLAPA